MKRISNDTINDVHKFNDSKLLRNLTTYQPGKYIACYYDKIWYIGVILKWSNENQNVKVKFMTPKRLNLQWANDLVSVGYHLQKLYGISPPLAKGQNTYVRLRSYNGGL